MDNILEINNLTKSYGKFTAVNNISFTIPKGKIVGLLGPNGSGKTTIIKAIMGLLSNTSGSIIVNGYPPGAEANRYISYLPDLMHIPTWFRVSQGISLFADFYTDFDAPRAVEMLKSMNISLDSPIKTLSKGMREKVQLALIMSRRAKLFILDEPLGAVDPASREFIISTILQHYPRESSILLSTHIIADIEPVLDVAIFLQRGEIFINKDAEVLREETNSSLDNLFREVFKHVS